MAKLNVIETPDKVSELRKYLAGKEYISYDLESTGLSKSSEVIGVSVCADESEATYIVIAAWSANNNKLAYLDGMKEAAAGLILGLVGKKLICHNGVFDCSMTESFFKISLIDNLFVDTMILAHLLDENRKVGLKPLATQYFGIDATKEEQEMKASVLTNGGVWAKANKEMYKADAYLLAKYGAKDALLTYKLFLELVPELYAQGLDKFFFEDESMPLLRGATYELNTVGLKIDGIKLTTVEKQLEAECLEAKAFINQEIAPHIKEKYPATSKKNTFNLGSNAQLSWLLFGVLGQDFKSLTKGGRDACRVMGIKTPYNPSARRSFIQESLRRAGSIASPEATVNGKVVRAKKFKEPWGYITCDDKTLKAIAPKLEWVVKLLEYKKKQKLLKTYVISIKDKVQYGIIHPSFKQAGTKTGRYSSSTPNFQNLPKNDKRIKNFIIPRPGKVFVGADYSQLEPRIFAFYSQDERLLTAFEGTDDFYSTIGVEVYDKLDCTASKEEAVDSFRSMYPRLRDETKVIALSGPYGTLAPQLAEKMGRTTEQTQEVLNNYFARFPKLLDMIKASHEKVKKDGYVENHFKRRRRLPEGLNIKRVYGNSKHEDLPYAARTILNQAVNFPIQSTGASVVNRAAIAFVRDRKIAGLDAPIVLQVHDSLVVECNENDGDKVLSLLQNSMETTTTLTGVRLEAIPKIGRTLAEV